VSVKEKAKYYRWRGKHTAMLVKGKGKVHPVTCYEGTEGKQRYSSTLSLTSALNEGGWLTPRPGRFTSGNDVSHSVEEA
jgi:hypothetical protein